MAMIQLLRTFLFVPSHRQDYFEKAQTAGADAILLDLEDGVPSGAKEHGRRLIRSLPMVSGPIPPVFVRVNPVDSAEFARDVEAIDPTSVAGIVLPRVEATDEVSRALQAFTIRAAGRNPDRGRRWLIPLIETARGVALATAIACADGVVAVGFGKEDYRLSLCLPSFEDDKAVEVPRALVSIAAHAAGCAAIDCVYPYYQDQKGLQKDTMQARALGYSAKFCIHPTQIRVIHKVFAPRLRDIRLAEKIVTFAERSESSVHVWSGRMVDRPMIVWAKNILERVRASHPDLHRKTRNRIR